MPAPPPVEPIAPPPPETAIRPPPRPTKTAPTTAVAAPPHTARPPPDPIAVEANLLGAALQALRQNNAPVQALALLHEYAARFLSGALSAEATLALVDSLRRLKRDELCGGWWKNNRSIACRARELQVLRGQLRLGAGQVRQAAADFDAVLPPRSTTRWRRALSMAAPAVARSSVIGSEREPNCALTSPVFRTVPAPPRCDPVLGRQPAERHHRCRGVAGRAGAGRA